MTLRDTSPGKAGRRFEFPQLGSGYVEGAARSLESGCPWRPVQRGFSEPLTPLSCCVSWLLAAAPSSRGLPWPDRSCLAQEVTTSGPCHPGLPPDYDRGNRGRTKLTPFASTWNQPCGGCPVCSGVPWGQAEGWLQLRYLLTQPLSSPCPVQPLSPPSGSHRHQNPASGSAGRELGPLHEAGLSSDRQEEKVSK